jgi:Fur family peroxide stress response transcriptional regulator
MNLTEIRNSLISKGLRVTPQRLSIFEAIIKLHDHPSADEIIAFIRQDQPNIATGTVYKVLDSLVENGLISKVKTDKDLMRYDALMVNHHHLYCVDSDKIHDYIDEELDALIAGYFAKKEISGFKIEDIRLQINGNFINEPS